MSEKTDEELRGLAALAESGASYGEFPDGATWADLEKARKLALIEEAHRSGSMSGGGDV